jgi:glycosyltransferase involved in cell wall biosynthesis
MLDVTAKGARRLAMKPKINVMFVQSQVAVGADSLIHVNIMRHLDRERFNVHVACTPGEAGAEAPSMKAVRQVPDLSVRPTVYMPGFRRRTPQQAWDSIRSSASFPTQLASLVAYVRNNRIDVLHCTEKPRDCLYTMLLSRLTGAKSCVHVHVKWSMEYGKVPRYAVQHADGVLSISDYVTETIVGMGTPKERVHTVLNALDSGRWDPSIDGRSVRESLGIPPDAPLLASVSRLFSWKGQRELISALPQVKAKFPNVRLIIVGADERYVHGGSFSEELKTLAQSLDVQQNVIFTGERSDVPQILAACDVFTLASFEEPFGVAYLEAMAMQKPIISIANGGTPEVVTHGRAGLLSEPWNVDQLANNIITLIGNPSLRKEMGHFGRNAVLTYFNPKRMADEVGAVYERIVEGRPSERFARPSEIEVRVAS